MLTALHIVYWFLIFNIGLFGLMGIPTALHKIGIPFVGLLLLADTLLKRGKAVQVPLIQWVIPFIIVCLLSKYVNDSSTFSLVTFLFNTLIPYFYFVVIINERSMKRINTVTKWVVGFILFQIPASWIKLAVMGQSEKGAIGTLSVGLGSFSTVFPVLIIGFLISFYLFSNKTKYMVLVAFFILFGIIGLKRAITFIIPLEVFLGYFLYLTFFAKKRDFRKIRNLFRIGFLGLVAFYLMVRTNPSLNKERKVWGSFDIEYLMNYSEGYTSSEGKGKKEMRRKDGLIYFINYNLNSNTYNMLFGDGAGRLILSNFDKDSGDMESLYGVRYGGRMGVIWLLLQVGILGMLLYLGLIISLIYRVVRKLPFRDNYLLLGYIIAAIFMLIDTLIYSNSFIGFEVMKNIFFYASALLFIQSILLKSGQKISVLYLNSKL